LGVWYSDLALGGQKLNDLFKGDRSYIDASRVSIKGQDGVLFPLVNIKDFLDCLNQKLEIKLKAKDSGFAWAHCGEFGWPKKIYDQKWEKASPHGVEIPLTYDVFFQVFNDYIGHKMKREDIVLMYDASLSLFSGIQMRVGKGNAYSELAWGSIGWTSGASIGVAIANKHHQDKRVFVFVGDGGFQNCSTGPSSAVRDRLNTIYFVFQNNTYGIDQYLIDKQVIIDNSYPEYNRLPNWDFAKLSESYGGRGYNVGTVGKLIAALDDAMSLKHQPAMIAIQIPPTDIPKVLLPPK